jgi:hypothetical protein
MFLSIVVHWACVLGWIHARENAVVDFRGMQLGVAILYITCALGCDELRGKRRAARVALWCNMWNSVRVSGVTVARGVHKRAYNHRLRMGTSQRRSRLDRAGLPWKHPL